MKQSKNVIAVLRNEQNYLRKNYGVKRLALFGSFVTGKTGLHSDIDVVVELDRPLGFAFIDLTEYLQKKLGRPVDVLTIEGIKSIRVNEVARSIRKDMVYV
jgi:predicted nucleotidyltransferase